MTTEQATFESGTRQPMLRAALLCLGLALMSAMLPMVEHAVVYGLVAAQLLMVIGPGWNDWRRQQLDLFEPIHLVGVINFLYFGMGSIWTLADPEHVAFDQHAVEYVPITLFFAVLGHGALLVGYYGPWFAPRTTRPSRERIRSTMFLLAPGLIGLLGYASFASLKRVMAVTGRFSIISSSLSQLSTLFLFAWALAWLLFLSKRRLRGLKLVLFGVFVPGILPIIYGTMNDKSLTLSFMGIPIIAMWYGRRKIPWRTLLVVGMVAVFVVFPVYNTVRTFDPNMSNSQRLTLTYQSMSSWNSESYMDRSVGSFKSRLALINAMTVVVRDTGRWVPYGMGESIFLPTLTFLIPRVIWPDKPLFVHGRTFGEKFRLIHPLDKRTHIASTIPGELYWNFDVPGVIIGMALWGLMLRWIYRRYGEGAGLDPIRRATFIVLLVSIAHMCEGHIAGHVNGLIRLLILLEAYRWFGRRTELLEVVPVSNQLEGKD